MFTRFRFNWSEVEFSIYSSYSMIIQLIGSTFSIGVFTNYLKLNDYIIGVMASISKILSAFVYAFAVTNFHIYMGLKFYKIFIIEFNNILFIY